METPTCQAPYQNGYRLPLNCEGVLTGLKYDPHKSPHSPAEELSFTWYFGL
jgi:hypothetical protein